jgi:hypothetical protein
MATPILIGGKRVGRFRASFLLFKESWRFLRADIELLVIPLVMGVINVCLLGLFIGVMAVVSQSQDNPIFTGDSLNSLDYLILFVVYVICAFTLALSQAAITHTVFTRIHNGNATLGQSIMVALRHSGTLLIWSLITSTVGIILKRIADRSALLGRIISGLLGAAWTIATFFVVPAIIIAKKSAVESIPYSITTFRQTWGETLISNITLGLFFFCAHFIALLSFFGMIILGVQIENLLVIIIAIVLGISWLILASLAQAALEGVIKTLLFVYATETTTPLNFNRELLEAMLVRTSPQPAAVLPPPPTL